MLDIKHILIIKELNHPYNQQIITLEDKRLENNGISPK